MWTANDGWDVIACLVLVALIVLVLKTCGDGDEQ